MQVSSKKNLFPGTISLGGTHAQLKQFLQMLVEFRDKHGLKQHKLNMSRTTKGDPLPDGKFRCADKPTAATTTIPTTTCSSGEGLGKRSTHNKRCEVSFFPLSLDVSPPRQREITLKGSYGVNSLFAKEGVKHERPARDPDKESGTEESIALNCLVKAT